MTVSFRTRLSSGDLLLGSFLKTPVPHLVEIAALASLDFVLLDAEHAPFTVRDLDVAMLAGRAAQLDVLVRIPFAAPAWIQQALDLGASGIVVPHVSSASAAASVVHAARFQNGSRGYSNSPRAGGYGTANMATHIARSDEAAAVIVQIEDATGVDAVEDIAAVPGLDALFIGRADLAVAYQTGDPAAPAVASAARRIIEAARANHIAVASFYADARAYDASGADKASMLVLGSDQSVLKSAWAAAVASVRAHDRPEPD